jgi:hypothetical protein
MKNLVYGISAVLTVTACVSLAAPEPAVVQGPDDWTLNVTFEHPQQIMLQSVGDNQQKRYWYMIITLTNKTGRDVDFYPKCELVTDTFEITPASKDTPLEVFEQIKKLYHRKYPFLEPLDNAGTKILQGEDNTKDIVIIWPDFDAKAKNIQFFIAGLSNETVAVDSPTEKDQAGKPVKVYLRKTLELSYKIGGDPAFRSKAKLAYEDKSWVMR